MKAAPAAMKITAVMVAIILNRIFASLENPWVRIASSVLSARGALKGNRLLAESTLEAMRTQERCLFGADDMKKLAPAHHQREPFFITRKRDLACRTATAA